MRDCEGIYIEQIIVHIVDARGTGFVPSQRELPLDDNEELREYFTSHIRTSIRHGSATAARFRSIRAGETSGLCASLHNESMSLIQASQGIAERLFEILEKDRRTKGADLAVCFYRAENYRHRFLALLKVDPSQVFQHQIETDDEGRKFVNYVLEPRAFTNEKLQKCAFIRPLNPRHSEYDMILLDRQVSDQRRRDVAQYFARDFLDAENAYDAHERTEQLYRSLLRARKHLETPQERTTLDLHVESIVRSKQFDTDEWIDRLPFSEAATRQIAQTLHEALPDRSFEIDQSLAERLRQKRVFRGNYNLKVQVDADHYEDVIRDVQVVDNDPDRDQYHRITIETDRWDEVQR